MDFNAIGELLWKLLNSPAVIAALGVGLVWLLARLFTAKPEWKKYEGTIIAAVKFAEKTIPDNVSNTAVKRLEAALKYVIKVYEETQGKTPPADVLASLTEGVQITHAALEADLALHGGEVA